MALSSERNMDILYQVLKNYKVAKLTDFFVFDGSYFNHDQRLIFKFHGSEYLFNLL